MTSAPKRKQPDLSQILVEGFPEVGNFEDIPKVRKIAGPATGPYVFVSQSYHLSLTTRQATQWQGRYRNWYVVPFHETPRRIKLTCKLQAQIHQLVSAVQQSICSLNQVAKQYTSAIFTTPIWKLTSENSTFFTQT